MWRKSVISSLVEILYADERLLAVRKPPGVHVHPTRLTPGELSLTDLLAPEWGPLWPVHRLDRPTSGAMVLARDAQAASDLARQWRERLVVKIYHAVLRGWLEEGQRTDRLVKKERKGEANLTALTEFRPLELWEPPWPWHGFLSLRVTLAEVQPHTGRRHQIRQHARGLAHPILGDTVWGDTALNSFVQERSALDRLCLFCRRLEFVHPEAGTPVVIEAPPTTEEMALLNRLKNGS